MGIEHLSGLGYGNGESFGIRTRGCGIFQYSDIRMECLSGFGYGNVAYFRIRIC